MVTSDHPYRWFDLNDELETHVKEISSRGCELVSTESVGHGSKSGFVLFWKGTDPR